MTGICVKAMMTFVKNALAMTVVNTVLGTLSSHKEALVSSLLGSAAGGDSTLHLHDNSMCCMVYVGDSVGISAQLLRRQESTLMSHTPERSLETAAGGQRSTPGGCGYTL